MKDKIYIATTVDKFENIIEFADTLKELCEKSGVSYQYCRNNTNRVFYNKFGTPIFIKKINIED